jgi:hypothetical protein
LVDFERRLFDCSASFGRARSCNCGEQTGEGQETVKTKALTLLTIFIVASLTTSYSYACQTINPQPQCLNIEFVAVSVQDNEQTQNTATIKAQITPDHNAINVKITNAYPNYEATVKYTIKNTGNRAVQFYTPTISNPASWALEVTSTNHRGIVLQPCQTTQGTTTVHVLASAQECRQYSFEVTNTATQK